jgi:hypothetical protein
MSNGNNDKPVNGPDGEPESFPVSREPASTGPAAPFVPCPDCRGSGRVVLLVSSRECVRCGGSGRLDAAGGVTPAIAAPRGPSGPADPGTQKRVVEVPGGRVTYTYDAYGRIASVTHTAGPGGVAAVWEYDYFPEAGNGDDARGEPAASEPNAPAFCAECSGTGHVTFLGGSRRCSRCRGPRD